MSLFCHNSRRATPAQQSKTGVVLPTLSLTDGRAQASGTIQSGCRSHDASQTDHGYHSESVRDPQIPVLELIWEGSSVMNIEISEQVSKRIEAIIGTSDVAVIRRLVERIAEDEQLLQSLMQDPPSDSDLRESLAACDRGREDVAHSKTVPMKQALSEIASELGIKLDR